MLVLYIAGFGTSRKVAGHSSLLEWHKHLKQEIKSREDFVDVCAAEKLHLQGQEVKWKAFCNMFNQWYESMVVYRFEKVRFDIWTLELIWRKYYFNVKGMF